MENICKNCKKPIDDDLLKYCSSKCQYEDFLNSQTGGKKPMNNSNTL